MHTQRKYNQKGFSVVLLVCIITIILILAIGSYIWVHTTKQNTLQSSAYTGVQVSPTPKISDYAKDLPANQKTILLLQHSDSSYEKVILPTSTVTSYITNLPVGDKVISQTPFGK